MSRCCATSLSFLFFVYIRRIHIHTHLIYTKKRKEREGAQHLLILIIFTSLLTTTYEIRNRQPWKRNGWLIARRDELGDEKPGWLNVFWTCVSRAADESRGTSWCVDATHRDVGCLLSACCHISANRFFSARVRTRNAWQSAVAAVALCDRDVLSIRTHL